MERVNLENLQKSKEEPSVVWSEYKNDCRHNPDMYFVFYEGKDRQYYDVRINSKTSNFNAYIAGNKAKVLAVFEKIKREDGEKSLKNTLFFIDKDYERTDKEFDSHIYVTEKYSIENYYVSHEAMKNILRCHFGLNLHSESAVEIMKLFDDRYNEFISILMELNLWAIACKSSDFIINFDLLGIKETPYRIIDISYRKIEQKINLEFDDLIKLYEEKLLQQKKFDTRYENDYKEYILKKENIRIFFKNETEYFKANIEYYFRGKFIICFLVHFLQTLTHKKLGKLKSDFQVNEKNVMSVFTNHADTPRSLESYLDKKISKVIVKGKETK